MEILFLSLLLVTAIVACLIFLSKFLSLKKRVNEPQLREMVLSYYNNPTSVQTAWVEVCKLSPDISEGSIAYELFREKFTDFFVMDVLASNNLPYALARLNVLRAPGAIPASLVKSILQGVLYRTDEKVSELAEAYYRVQGYDALRALYEYSCYKKRLDEDKIFGENTENWEPIFYFYCACANFIIDHPLKSFHQKIKLLMYERSNYDTDPALGLVINKVRFKTLVLLYKREYISLEDKSKVEAELINLRNWAIKRLKENSYPEEDGILTTIEELDLMVKTPMIISKV